MTTSLTPPAHETAAKLASATYTVEQLARLLQCGPRHVWRLADANTIPGKLRIGRLVRFSRSIVDRWIADGCHPAHAAAHLSAPDAEVPAQQHQSH